MKDYKKQLLKLATSSQKYIAFIAILVFIGMCGAIVWISSQQLLREPAEGLVLDQVSSSSRPDLDEEVAKTLIELEDQNIEVKALFEESRNNPFVE